MKKYSLFVLISLLSYQVNAQNQLGDSSENEEYYDPDYLGEQGLFGGINVGASLLNSTYPASELFDVGDYIDFTLMFRIRKNPKFINFGVGVQFSRHRFGVKNNQYITISNNGIIQSEFCRDMEITNTFIKVRSVSFPLAVYFRPRDIRFLNQTIISFGIVPGFNFKKGIHKLEYEEDIFTDYKRRERIDFNMPLTKFNYLIQFSFRNFMFSYEHAVHEPSSKNFSGGIHKFGVGVFI